MALVGTDILYAAELLMDSEVVAIPTETVYGLAGNGLDINTIEKIYLVKNRPATNPLILHIHSIDAAYDLAEYIPEMAIKLASVFWPGPLTLVLPKKSSVPDLATGGLNTVAIRIPNHPLTLELLSKIHFPLAAPSANLSNSVSPTTAHHVNEQIGGKIKYILDGGRCKKGIESTIVSFKNGIPEILRLGAISPEQLQEVSGDIIVNGHHSKIAAPGMFPKHYSPKTRLIVSQNLRQAITGLNGQNIGVLTFMRDAEIAENESLFVDSLSESGDLSEAAYNLYDKLYCMDKMGFDCILAEFVPDQGIGKSINDRLKRASNQ